VSKWEYVFVEGHNFREILMINGKIIDTHPVVWEWLNSMGSQGWEVINISSQPTAGTFGLIGNWYMVLKRPLAATVPLKF